MDRVVGINILYLLILLAAAILPGGISDYDAYVLLLVSVVYALQIRSFKVYVSALICGGMVCAVSMFRSPLHAFIDCTRIFFVFSSLYAGACFRVDKYDFRLIRRMYFFVLLAMVAGMASPSLWDGDSMRYLGIFHGTNLSASVFLMLGIAVWEMEKKGEGRLKVLLLLVAVTLLYIWASGTRSLLLGLPYWLYQLFSRSMAWILFVFLLVAGMFYLFEPAELIVEKVRLEKDDSMMTRSVLYLQLWTGILDNYALIPHGSHAGWDMIRAFTADLIYSPHNDFLNFIYDWGAIFYIFCIMAAVRLKRFVRLNLEFGLILLALLSCALHNMLFNVVVWIPFTVILMARRTTDEIGKVCYERN